MNSFPQTLKDLKTALREGWEYIGEGVNQNLMLSMPRHTDIQALLAAREETYASEIIIRKKWPLLNF